MNIQKKENSSYLIRKIILKQSKLAGMGHIGSALSVADIMAVLYEKILHIPSLNDSKRDRFILSKGHAALSQYAALHLKGWLSQEQLNTYGMDHSHLGVHPEHMLPGIEFSTGSLGHGLSIGIGAALAARLNNLSYRVFVLMSDAECNEGSVWEAAMFAAQHKISNLIAIIDDNKQQALGYTKDVLNLDPLEQRWKAFGWNTCQVDGHNQNQMAQTIEKFDMHDDRPHMIVANTTFGKGVAFMERQIPWHYKSMNDQQYAQALAELEQTR